MLLLIIILLCGLIFTDAYFTYKDAITNSPLSEKIISIKNKIFS